MFSQVRQALDSLAAALDGVDGAPTGELREALGLAKPLRAKLETLETAVAAQIAQRERHGDGGAGVLHQIAAVPRSEAARNVRTAAELERVPDAQSALAEGEMCMANAARLARAARDTSPDAVQDDAEFVNLAKTLPPDEFAQASQRWTAQHRNAADLAERHRRNRRNRSVRFWNGDDGTVQMRGAFDAEMGARIQARIRDEAERLRQADRRLLRNGTAASPQDAALQDTAPNSTAGDGVVPDGAARNRSSGDGAVRTRDQRMADALDRILAHAGPAPITIHESGSSDAAAGDSTNKCLSSNATFPGGLPTDATAVDDETNSDVVTASASCCGDDAATGCGHAPCDCTGAQGHTAHSTQIIVRADLASLLDECSGIGEIAGAGLLPAGVVDRLSCNADVSVVLFGDQLTPLYEAVASRAPTAAQRRALIARDGACVGCGAPPGDCEAHHIIPWKRGGPTKIDNLVLVCWSCHDRIHDHNWQVIRRNGRYRLIPPDAESPPNPAPAHKPVSSCNLAQSREPALFP
ncbi:HNH endonuclease [Candidatus Poriferisodalis sp.]|uniref:HNH endonuclease n=1 Tax=Candidatus Poriferisodalis sp. TaxID=3101277 RepID=UPI003B0154E3